MLFINGKERCKKYMLATIMFSMGMISGMAYLIFWFVQKIRKKPKDIWTKRGLLISAGLFFGGMVLMGTSKPAVSKNQSDIPLIQQVAQTETQVTENVTETDSEVHAVADSEHDTKVAEEQAKAEQEAKAAEEQAKAEQEAKDAEEAAKKAEEGKNSVSTEYKNALKQAETYSSLMHMSKQAIYDQLTSEYGGQFPADAAQYAIDNLGADYKQNALKSAETYQSMMSMSKQDIYDQLVSEYGGQFTPEEAQYAIDNLD